MGVHIHMVYSQWLNWAFDANGSFGDFYMNTLIAIDREYCGETKPANYSKSALLALVSL